VTPTALSPPSARRAEVFGLRLSADLVVLSACHTGLASGALADVSPGDD